MNEYPLVIVPLSEEDGGGFIGIVPDLAGCMSDGETREEALANTLLAIDEWLDEAERSGKKVPVPGSAARRSRAKDKALVAAVKNLVDSFDDIDNRIQNLEVNFKDLSEQVENQDAWARFATLTGAPSDSDEAKTLPC